LHFFTTSVPPLFAPRRNYIEFDAVYRPMDSTIFPFATVELRLFSEEPLVLPESLAMRGRAHRHVVVSPEHSSTQPTDWFSSKIGEQTAQACDMAWFRQLAKLRDDIIAPNVEQQERKLGLFGNRLTRRGVDRLRDSLRFM